MLSTAGSENVVLNPELKAQASREGLKGLNAAMRLYDSSREEEAKQSSMVTVSSEQQPATKPTANAFMSNTFEEDEDPRQSKRQKVSD